MEILNRPDPSIQDLTRAIVKHALAVRKLPQLHYATMVIVIERNSILIAKSVKEEMDNAGLARHCFMRESKKRGRDGNGDELRAGTYSLFCYGGVREVLRKC